MAAFISKELKSPEEVLNDLGSNIGNDFSIKLDKPELLEVSLTDFLQKHIAKNAEIIEKIKDTWLESAVEIRNLFDEEVVKKEKSCLNGKTHSSKTILSLVDEVTSWAKNRADLTLNETLVKKFTQSALDNAVKADFKKKGVRVTHPAFEEIEALIEEIQPSDLFKKIILYHYRQGIQKKLLEYKANHPEKSFDDLLTLIERSIT